MQKYVQLIETETIIAKASPPKTTNKFLIIIGPRQQQTF